MNITKEQVKDIATKAAKKVVETHNSMTAEEKIICVATAALCISAFAFMKAASTAKKAKRKIKACEKRIAKLEDAMLEDKKKETENGGLEECFLQ